MMLRDMTEADLETVARIEREVHVHPWTSGNFSDALRSQYWCKLYEVDGQLLGYAILMPVLDEVELLDISIAGRFQHQGWGYKLLEEIMALARRQNMSRMLLEVRASNTAAISLYRKAGFNNIGLRRDYYPAHNGREDAILMGCEL